MKNFSIKRIIAGILSTIMVMTSLDFFKLNLNATTILNDVKYFGYTGAIQTYTIPETGYYILECFGAEGGEDTHYFWHPNETVSSVPTKGGRGGYTKSKCYFDKGTKLYIFVGEKGVNGSETIFCGNESYNGGAASNGNCTGSGGGATDVRINGTSIDSRIQVSGGGGGASWNIEGMDGGAALSGNNGTLGNGTKPSSYGGGGGGGYYGGTPGANNATAARGGSNYFNNSYGILMENKSGINEGNGYVNIIRCQDYSLIIDPNGGIYDGLNNQIYMEKDKNTSNSQEFNYTGNVQTYTVSASGIYKLEVYGAKGGNDGSALGGYGGYTSAYVSLINGDKLYVYVGGAGADNGSTAGWNGGGTAQTSGGNGAGGGGTDIRLNGQGNGYNSSIDNRIIVAGGGGGAAGGAPWINGRPGGGSATTSTKYQGGNVSSYYTGGGGGGGYYGGIAGIEFISDGSNRHNYQAGGGGGTNFFDTTYGVLIASQAGQRNGNGYAKISFVPSSELIKTPTREGYTFKGWKISGNGTLSGNIFEYGKGTTTLTAQWTKNATASSLTINPNGGVYDDKKESSIYTQNSGTTKNIKTPVREGYKFTGWTKSGGGELSKTTYTFNTTDATLIANWKQITSSLTINPNDGLYNGSTDRVVENNLAYGTIKNISNPVKKGYTFIGWDISGTGAYFDDKGFHMGESDIVLTAQWKIASYKLTVNPNGGTWNKSSDTQKFTIDYNATKSISTPTAPTGYVFIGWTLTGAESTMSSLTSASTFKMGTSNATLTANYVEDEIPVTYIDVVGNTSGAELGRKTVMKHYNDKVSGSNIGSSTADNAYYNGYYYVSDTSATVGTSGATVYRIFKLRTINISGAVSWTDNSNKWSTRPNEVTVSLYRDGSKVVSTTGLTSSNSNNYSFNNVPKYSTSDGHVYNYTVSQSEAVSKTSPEDKYTTTQNTYNFTNVLGNTDKDADNKGLTVKGSIYWEDKGDTLGYRPKTVTITLYQNGKEYKTIEVDSFNDNTYEFSKLPKYDKDLNKYEYTVKETMVANYLVTENGQPVLKDAYSIKADTPNALDFTNVFNVPDSAPIPVKPEHINNVTVKTNTDDMITISLKGMETIINNDLSVSYGNNYNGQVYNLSANNIGTVLSSINSGKYEISYLDATHVLNDITCNGDNNIWIEGSGDKYYLVIKDTNVDVSGTITLNFSKKDHIGYQTYADVSNYFKVGIETTAIMSLESEVFAISDMIIEAEDTYSVIYNNSDTIDENIYNEGDEVEVLDYQGELPENKEFLGWALSEDVEEPDYLVGDIISIKDMNISLYPVFKDIEEEISEIETTEETTESSESIEESSETEESTMEETSSEEETTESEEISTETNSSEEAASTEEESSESTETIESSKLEK